MRYRLLVGFKIAPVIDVMLRKAITLTTCHGWAENESVLLPRRSIELGGRRDPGAVLRRHQWLMLTLDSGF